MEPQLGTDLSHVKLHTGGDSAAAADRLGARAFAIGADVHFGAGEFAPGTKEGDRLIAHELTHTVQAQKSGVQRKPSDAAHGHVDAASEVSQPGEPAEQEADAVAGAAAEALHERGGKKIARKPGKEAAPPIGAKLSGRKIFRETGKGGAKDAPTAGANAAGDAAHGGGTSEKPGAGAQGNGGKTATGSASATPAHADKAAASNDTPAPDKAAAASGDKERGGGPANASGGKEDGAARAGAGKADATDPTLETAKKAVQDAINANVWGEWSPEKFAAVGEGFKRALAIFQTLPPTEQQANAGWGEHWAAGAATLERESNNLRIHLACAAAGPVSYSTAKGGIEFSYMFISQYIHVNDSALKSLDRTVQWLGAHAADDPAKTPPDTDEDKLQKARLGLKPGEELAKGMAAEGPQRQQAMPDVPLTPELLALQKELKERAKGKNQDKRVPMTDAEAALAGWALLSLTSDKKSRDATEFTAVKYATGGEAREKTHAVLKGGVFTWAQGEDKGQKVKSPNWQQNDAQTGKEVNIYEKAAYRISMTKAKVAIEILREHGFGGEADACAQEVTMDDNYEAVTKAQDKAKKIGHVSTEQQNEKAEADVRASGRLIFVMNEAGQFFAAESQLFAVHHSTFLAGGAVAAAGELQLSSGVVTVLSDQSGHYLPGPAFIWQAVKQLEAGGVNAKGVTVELAGIGELNGAEFLTRFDPRDPESLSFDRAKAVQQVRAYLARKKS